MISSARTRLAAMATVVAVVLALTACTADTRSTVTIEEYKSRTEQIAATLTDTIKDVPRDPQGPSGGEDGVTISDRYVDVEGGRSQQNPWRYWIWRGTFTFAKDSGTTPEDAADRMAEVLEDGGWVASVHDQGERIGTYEFRRSGESDPKSSEEWHVAIKFYHRVPQLSISIVSPSSNASDGTTEAAREFAHVASRMEAVLDHQQKIVDDPGLRLRHFFGSAPGHDRDDYLAARAGWHTAAGEVREFIRTVREHLGNPSPAPPGHAVRRSR